MSDTQPEDQYIDPHYDMDENSVTENYFASVYVKVEVNEDYEEENEMPTGNERFMNLHQKKKPKKPYKRILKDLSCDQCDYKTPYKNCLEIHILGHSDAKPLTCNLCDYKTRFPASLKRHIIFKHEDPGTKDLPTYKCNMCSYQTYIKCNLKSHQRKHDLSKQFKCPECSYSTSYKHNIVKHSRTHNKNENNQTVINKVHKPKEDATYYCDKCPFTTKYEGHITRHLAKIHFEVSEKASRCEHCSFSTRTGWRLNVHKKRSHQDNALKCPHCDFQTVYRCAFKEHKLAHTEGYRNSQHQWLDTLFSNSSKLNEQNTKEEQASELMKMCEIRSKIENDAGIDKVESTSIYNELKIKSDDPIYYTFDQESVDQTPSNNQHQFHYTKNNEYLVDAEVESALGTVKVIESPNVDRPFQCPTCKYTSKFKASVQRHYQRHHTSLNRPYKCVNCDFCTKTKDQIALHNKRSKSEEILICKICGYTSVFKCQFLMHEKEHYPFKCVRCEFRCKKKPDMQKHFTIVHLGNGLKCSHCDYQASRKESLLCHEAIHTGKKPFQCQFCDYTSVRRSLLENHVNKCHKKTIVETIIDDSKIKALKMKSVEGKDDKIVIKLNSV